MVGMKGTSGVHVLMRKHTHYYDPRGGGGGGTQVY